MSTNICVITNPCELDYSQLRLKKPFEIQQDKKILFEVSYNNADLILQSPIGYVPYKPSVYEDSYGYIDIVFNDASKSFMDGIKDLEDFIFNKLRNKIMYTNMLEGKVVSPCNTNKKIRFVSNDINNVSLFDAFDKIEVGKIGQTKKDSKVSIIFHIVGVMVYGGSLNKYGLYLRLLQGQVHNIALAQHIPTINASENHDRMDVYMKMSKVGIPMQAICQKMMMDGVATHEIEDIVYNIQNIRNRDRDCCDNMAVTREHHNTSNMNGVSAELEKYVKMMRMGIPLGAIHQKMMMDGLHNDHIDQFSNLTKKQKPNTSLPPPPPPGPPPPPPLGMRMPPPPPPGPPPPLGIFKNVQHLHQRKSVVAPDPSAFLADIKNGNFLLKKSQASIEPIKNIGVINKVLRCVDTSRKVPSLDEILTARKNLRSINK